MNCYLLEVESTNDGLTKILNKEGKEEFMNIDENKLYVHAETFREAASVVKEGWLKSIEILGYSIAVFPVKSTSGHLGPSVRE